jgi:hypothetical protein
MLASVVYYIWRETNVWLQGKAFCNVLVVYSDIVKCIIYKVNLLCNMASSDTNKRLYISWGISDDIFFYSS